MFDMLYQQPSTFAYLYIVIEPNYLRVLSSAWDILWLGRQNKDIHLNNCPDIDGS